MPAAVDHEERRQKIASIVAGIISREGLAAVSIREVAAVAGYSTTIVTHYFRSKRDLLLHTYQAAALRAQARVDQALASDGSDLQGYLEALLPLDTASLQDWRVYFAFWQVASTDADFATEQRRRTADVRTMIAGIIGQRALTVAASPPVDPEVTAKRLLTVLLGIAVQAMFDAQDWSAARQKAFLDAELRTLFATG